VLCKVRIDDDFASSASNNKADLIDEPITPDVFWPNNVDVEKRICLRGPEKFHNGFDQMRIIATAGDKELLACSHKIIGFARVKNSPAGLETFITYSPADSGTFAL
jgi:hypothetical protein